MRRATRCFPRWINVVCAACAFGFCFLPACCHRSKEAAPVLARAGDRCITVPQFVARCELALRPSLSGPSPEQKKRLLELLIDEKLLALEAEQQRLARDEHLMEVTSLYADLAAARALYAREVQGKVSLSPEEISTAARRMAEVRTVQFFLTKDRGQAEAAHQQLLANCSFAQVLAATGTLAPDTTRFRFHARWGDLEEALDEAVFGLQPGEISDVIKTSRGYVVCRVDSIARSHFLGETGAGELHHKAAKILRARKEAARSAAYVKQLMGTKKVEVEEEAFAVLADALVRHIDFSDRSLPPFAERQQLLSDDILVPSQKAIGTAAQMVVLRFSGGQWTISDVLRRWRVLHPPVDVSSPAACRASLVRILSTMVRDHFLAQEAHRRGLYKDPQVRAETELWRDYFLAHMMQERLRKDSGPDFSLRRHLLLLRGGVAVEQDTTLLGSIDLTRLPVVAVRPGQYGALVVPPWPEFSN